MGVGAYGAVAAAAERVAYVPSAVGFGHTVVWQCVFLQMAAVGLDDFGELFGQEGILAADLVRGLLQNRS